MHGKQISVGTTSKKNIVFIKGKNSSTINTELKEVFESYGNVIMSEKTISQNTSDYIISVRFPTEDRAHSFLIDYENNRQKFDMIKQAVSFDKKKEIFQNFKKHQGILYFKLSPIKEGV